MYSDTFMVSPETLDAMLKELAKGIRRECGSKAGIEIVLAGGTAVMASYGFRLSTTDIDAEVPLALRPIIRKVGEKNGYPIGWLNDDFRKTASYSSNIRLYSRPYKSFGNVLDVRVLKDEHLIAMKARSARTYKHDMSDIVGIIHAMREQEKTPTMASIQKAFADLYGENCEIGEVPRELIAQCLETADLVVLYESCVAAEQKAREEILAAEREHPKITHEQNTHATKPSQQADAFDGWLLNSSSSDGRCDESAKTPQEHSR